MAELSRAQEGMLKSLARRRIREREGLFLVEGVRGVEELLGSGIDLHLAVASSSLEDTERGRALVERLTARTDVRRVPEHALARLAPTSTPQGVLVAARLPRRTLDELPSPATGTGAGGGRGAGPGQPGYPGPLRGRLRCPCPGGPSRHGLDPWNPKAVRGAAGALFRLPVLQPDRGELLAWLSRVELPLWVADAGGVPVGVLERPARLALVVGNEGAGAGEDLRSAAAATVAVPLRPGAESLNVGVAAGILLHRLAEGA